ncbi:hypothetical protein CT676_32815 [Bradyrhizobium sp. MOS001]|uniref:hypothetical protein n=1 Tax=unclassified Bradyrhizobium TaxID=2631580 RepID=UPI0010754036|nr:hypothetical protein [Bradyrhizobium sp. MOS001]TFW56889.1 hypothetical protein CT676_32815 [Bradyrhizobium sp. MOS001]
MAHSSHFLQLVAGACAASAAVFGSVAARLRAEESNPPPETTTIRLAKKPSICIAPQYVVSDLLNAEGISKLVYVESDAGVEQTKAIAKGDIDITRVRPQIFRLFFRAAESANRTSR